MSAEGLLDLARANPDLADILAALATNLEPLGLKGLELYQYSAGQFHPLGQIPANTDMSNSVQEASLDDEEAPVAPSASYDEMGNTARLLLPLRSGNLPLGCMVLWRHDTPFRSDEIALAARVGEAAVPALDRMLLRERVRAQTRQLDLIGEISNQLISLRPLEDRWVDIAPLLSRAFDASKVRIFEVAEGSTGAPALAAISHPLGSMDLPGDLEASPAVLSALERRGTITSGGDGATRDETTILAVPLMVEDRVLGALELQRKDASHFSSEQRAMASMLASQLAIAALEAYNYSQQQQYSWFNTVMLEVARHAAQPGEMDTALRAVLHLTTLLAGARWALLFLPESDGASLALGPSSGLNRESLQSLQTVRLSASDFGIHPPYSETTQPMPTELPPPLQAVTGNPECLLFALSDGVSLLGLLLVAGPSAAEPRRALLSGIAHQISLRIENHRLVEDLALRRSLERELETARKIQRSFMPEAMPRIDSWEVFASWSAAGQVGGDFFDFVPLPASDRGPRWGVIIADVADKGVPAALYMALCRTLIRSLGGALSDPAAALSRLNEIIVADGQIDLYLGIVYGVLEPGGGLFRFCNAGHQPPILIDAEGAQQILAGHGMMLGVSARANYTEQAVTINGGSSLILVTDGVTEANNPDGKLYGLESLSRIIRAERYASAHDIGAAIRNDVAKYCLPGEPQDDLTMIVLKRT